jgi:CheY-like chemotaxis protein
MEKKAFGTYEIAEICQVTPSTVGNWIEKGMIPTFTTGGGHRRVWAGDLAAFLKKHNIPLPDALKALAPLEILVVDDEEPVRKMIRRTLQKLYPKSQIQEASDGFEAGQKVAQLIPSLVILDLKLPGVDGLKVCRSIRSNERLKNIKVLVISGHNLDESKKQSLAAGASDFLGKPFGIDDLKEKVSKLVEH